MKTINCAECNVEYTYEPVVGYPDKRKYCANCSEKKKLTWNANSHLKDDEAHIAETVPMNPEPENSLEYEIRSREVRCRALESAIKVTKKLNTDDYVSDLMANARQFEEWILNGQKGQA